MFSAGKHRGLLIPTLVDLDWRKWHLLDVALREDGEAGEALHRGDLEEKWRGRWVLREELTPPSYEQDQSRPIFVSLCRSHLASIKTYITLPGRSLHSTPTRRHREQGRVLSH